MIGTSIGIALVPADGEDPDQILKNADMALYHAKADGRGRYCFFAPEMDKRLRARRALEIDLRKALAAEEFELFYQPLINLKTRRGHGLRSADALVSSSPRDGRADGLHSRSPKRSACSYRWGNGRSAVPAAMPRPGPAR